MRDITIENGIPIPKKTEIALEDKFPEFLALKISDSFVIPNERFPLYLVIADWGCQHNQRHEVRKLDNGDYRVWRVR